MAGENNTIHTPFDFRERKAEENTHGRGGIFFLSPEQICADPFSARRINTNKIIRLAAQMRRYGLSEPILVRILEGNTLFPRYALAGEEAVFRAACLAEISKIPCVLAPEAPQNNAENHIFAQIREKSLHIFEQAMAFRMLMEEFHLTQEDIARKSGLSQSAVANKLRLLRLDPSEQREILHAGLGERHARALLRLHREERKVALNAIVCQKLTVSATEALIDSILEQKHAQNATNSADNPQKTSTSVTEIAMQKQESQGVLPRKFALQSLQPLYNSIEKTLSIFRKTGKSAEMTRTESSDEICITIRIPTNA